MSMSNVEFRTELGKVCGATKAVRPAFQALMLDAMEFFRDRNCNTARLTTLVHSCANVSILKTNHIKAFIEAHCDVTWGKLKDGSRGYKKKGDGAVTMPTQNWWEWEKPKPIKPEKAANDAPAKSGSPAPVEDEDPIEDADKQAQDQFDFDQALIAFLHQATEHVTELNEDQLDRLAKLERLAGTINMKKAV